MVDVDIAIAGAGPVGAACALFLRERGVPAARIALVDARTAEAADRDDRLIAISHGSATLLARLGAWQHAAPRATAIHTIHVSHRGRFGRTVIERDDYGVPALGHVIRHGDLTAALDQALQRRGIEVRRPARMSGVDVEGEGLRIVLDDGASFTARHIVHAEGGLFDAQRRRAIHRDYAQTAVTTVVTLVEPPSDTLAATAFERFTDDGPIALLPAVERVDGRERRGYAVVWCGKPDDAARRAALPDDAFLAALHTAFGDRLGRFATAGVRRTYPLGLNAVDVPARVLAARSAAFAIGNAAQTLHPVAGQGLNLGLRDAHELAALLASDDANAERLVARYVAARRLDRAATVDLTDLMPRVFASARAPVVLARGLALALLDVAPPLRGLFARQMMNGRR
jgi:2-octaprenyl-6-methoxyphenol hydroxylase